MTTEYQDRSLILLGPQPEYESLKASLEFVKRDGPVALVTAGWETDEHEDADLKLAIQDATGRDSFNLHLFQRSEKLFAEDWPLIQTLRDRQDELRHLRDAYNDRLDFLLQAARKLIRKQESLIDLSPESESAIEMVRQLDQQYFVRTSQIVDRYEETLKTSERPLVVQQRGEILEQLKDAKAILISGGHVAIILNRLKIYGILDMFPELPVIAWSGGAMALADQVVLFHDSPPQGPGNPELMRAGMSCFHDVLPLPAAKKRLNLNDQARVELFARRFDRFKCVIFDEQTILHRENGRWHSHDMTSISRLGNSGSVVQFNA